MIDTVISTSITSNYRTNWGYDRIAKDAISNHLDSGKARIIARSGENIQNLQDICDESIEEIIFEDYGDGFSYQLLGLLYSTKNGEQQSIGQFGEGLKLLSSACLREGLDISIESRDWRAVPFFGDVEIDGRQIQQLCYKVEEKEEGPTRTVFINPSSEFVGVCRALPSKVLQLSDRKPIAEHPMGEIYDSIDDNHKLFIKGIHVQDLEYSLFDYNLTFTTNLSPDRNSLNHDELTNEISMLLRSVLNNKELCRKLIDGNKEKSTIELYALKKWDAKGLAGDIFRAAYGRDAVLYCTDSQHGTNQYIRSLGIPVIKIDNTELVMLLKGDSVKDTNQVYYEKVNDKKVLSRTDLTNRETNYFVFSNLFLSYAAKKLDLTAIPKLGIVVNTENLNGLQTLNMIYLTKDKLNDVPFQEKCDLLSIRKLASTILHELGHWSTDSDHGDFTEFPRFFVDALAKEYSSHLIADVLKLDDVYKFGAFVDRNLRTLAKLDKDLCYEAIDLLYTLSANFKIQQDIELPSVYERLNTPYNDTETDNLFISWLINEQLDASEFHIPISYTSDARGLGYRLSSNKKLIVESNQLIPEHYLGVPSEGEVIVQLNPDTRKNIYPESKT